MRRLLLAAAAVTAVSAASAANAALTIGSGSSVSINGFITPITSGDVSQATALDFNAGTGTTPGTAGLVTSYTGTGSLNFLCTSACGTIQDLPSLLVGPQSIANFFSLTNGINFDLTSITGVTRTPGFLDVTAAGTFRVTGFDPAPGIFYLSTQANGNTTFSAAATAAVPEPATWGLMLLGFAGMGMVLRRRRRPALAQLA